jgi:ribosomal protein S18 acetylase RimI-like enzyme
VTAKTEVAPCAIADLPQLYALAMRVAGALPGWSRRRVIQLLLDDVVFVAREARRPIGYIALAQTSAAELLVEQVVIAPDHEPCATGDGLLAEAESFGVAERARSLRVRIDESDWAARGFYRRRGFGPVADDVLELVLLGQRQVRTGQVHSQPEAGMMTAQ